MERSKAYTKNKARRPNYIALAYRLPPPLRGRYAPKQWMNYLTIDFSKKGTKHVKSPSIITDPNTVQNLSK